MSENTDYDIDIVSILKDCNAVLYGQFILASGQKSTYYIDIKKASTNPDSLYKISKKIAAIIKRERKENVVIGGVELGGVPIATAVSLEMRKPLLIIRKTVKDYGTKSQYIGDFKPSDEIILMEDVTTSGGSVKRAVEHIRKEGGVINTVIVIVDRCSGAKESLKEIGINLIPLVTANDLIDSKK